MSGYVSLYSNFNILIMPFNSIRQVAAPCNATRARYAVLLCSVVQCCLAWQLVCPVLFQRNGSLFVAALSEIRPQTVTSVHSRRPRDLCLAGRAVHVAGSRGDVLPPRSQWRIGVRLLDDTWTRMMSTDDSRLVHWYDTHSLSLTSNDL